MNFMDQQTVSAQQYYLQICIDVEQAFSPFSSSATLAWYDEAKDKKYPM
jgi:hypothetical protein